MAIATLSLRHMRRLVLEIVAVPSSLARDCRAKREIEKDNRQRQGEYSRVLPALIVDLVHVAVALVVGILGFDIKYLGLIQELQVEAEHFLVLGVLGVICLRWSHGRKICRVVLVPESRV